MTLKVVVSDPTSGKSVQKEITDDSSKNLMGLKLNDKIKGETVGLQGYELELTGGSDNCGFPMRKDVEGTGRKKILSYQGVGIKKQRKGMLQRKTVCGNTVHSDIAQINVKVTKQGNQNIFETKKSQTEKTKDAEKEKSEKPSEKKKAETTKNTAENKTSEKPKEN